MDDKAVSNRYIYRVLHHIKDHIESVQINLDEGFNEPPACTNCEKVKKRDRTAEIHMELNLALGMIENALMEDRGRNRKDDKYV